MAKANQSISNYLHMLPNVVSILLVYCTASYLIVEGGCQAQHLKQATLPKDSSSRYYIKRASPSTIASPVHNVDRFNQYDQRDVKRRSSPSAGDFQLKSTLTKDEAELKSPAESIAIEDFSKYSKRDFNNEGNTKNLNIDNIRMMQLLGYYQSRNRPKHSSNANTTPSSKYLSRFPPVLHFNKLFDGSPRIKTISEYSGASTTTSKTFDDSKRNIFFSKGWRPALSKDTQEASTQREDKNMAQPPKGFAFTSNHWGPLGKRAPLIY